MSDRKWKVLRSETVGNTKVSMIQRDAVFEVSVLCRVDADDEHEHVYTRNSQQRARAIMDNIIRELRSHEQLSCKELNDLAKSGIFVK